MSNLIKESKYKCEGLNKLAENIGEWADENNIWAKTKSGDFNFPEKISLIHLELSKAIETHVQSTLDLPSENIPSISIITESLAEAVIKILDLCDHMAIDIEKSIELKMLFNENRPHKHRKEY